MRKQKDISRDYEHQQQMFQIQKLNMSMQEEKSAQIESQSNLEAIKAKEQLYRIENKIKLRQEFYHSKILETATKAKKRIEASIDGYDKHHLI